MGPRTQAALVQGLWVVALALCASSCGTADRHSRPPKAQPPSRLPACRAQAGGTEVPGVRRSRKRIVVFGQVMKPGTYVYRTGMTLVQAIAEAGGLTHQAAPSRTVITRQIDGRAHRVQVRLRAIGKGPDPPLCPGDSIFVPQ